MNVDWNKYGLSDVREPTPEEIEQALRRGAHERAETFRAVFGGLAARLGRAAESGRQEVDRGSFGERLTRFYEYAGSRFILVFERVERQGDVKVAAIYLQ
jgi:hypothetical protein